MAERRLVFGIGTGRSGTVSLAKLLDAQPKFNVTHEMTRTTRSGRIWRRLAEPIPWRASENEVAATVDLILHRRGSVVGDVGSSWLPHLPALLRQYPSARVVCLERPREEVVTSFLRKTGHSNHWMPGADRVVDPRFDPVFPKYEDAESKSAAVGLYWDEYRRLVGALRAAQPGRVRSWSMRDALNTEQGTAEVLEFAGVAPAAQVVPKQRHFNRVRS
jgi:hypothetical protein